MRPTVSIGSFQTSLLTLVKLHCVHCIAQMSTKPFCPQTCAPPPTRKCVNFENLHWFWVFPQFRPFWGGRGDNPNVCGQECHSGRNAYISNSKNVVNVRLFLHILNSVPKKNLQYNFYLRQKHSPESKYVVSWVVQKQCACGGTLPKSIL